MSQLLIIVALFAVLWFVMIRPQRAKAQQQQRLLGTVAPGDEILTVGGIYGIVQELEPDEDGGDLIVEIADGIHVRVARKALALVVKPDDEEDEQAVEDEGDHAAVADQETASDPADPALPPGVEESHGGAETAGSGTADPAAAPERS